MQRASPNRRTIKRALAWAALAVLPGACGSGGGEGAACDPGSEFCGDIPAAAAACTDARFWPLDVQSGTYPLTVHYSRHADADQASDILAILEKSWQVLVDESGFAAPLADGGLCGPDERFDVFVWRGLDGAFVEAVADNPATEHDDFSTYMAINPFGSFGNDFLDTTLAHELNHASQGADDWWESALIFEMTATYAEALVFPEQDDYFYTLQDFQAHPDWSLFYDDRYETWYMYGAAMFLHFLEQRHYPDDPGFIARIWRASRSDPAVGRPDYIDAMRSVLANERGITLDEAIVEFMQWRWFVAEFDDGAHFAQGAAWPSAVAHEELDADISRASVELEAMIYGVQYLRLVNGGSGERQLAVDLAAQETDVEWRLTTVRGDPVAGSVTVPAQGALVVLAVVLPLADVATDTLDFSPRSAVLELTALE